VRVWEALEETIAPASLSAGGDHVILPIHSQPVWCRASASTTKSVSTTTSLHKPSHSTSASHLLAPLLAVRARHSTC
jgi:hypothetical protein